MPFGEISALGEKKLIKIAIEIVKERERGGGGGWGVGVGGRGTESAREGGGEERESV